MLSSVCETSVPSTTGNRSRTRPSRRATISARDGSPRRAGSVADMSTPIISPRAVSRRRTRTPGSAAVRIACHASARRSIEPHISAKATSTQPGVAATSALPIDSSPIRCSASQSSPTRGQGAAHDGEPAAPRGRRAGDRCPGSRLERRQAARRGRAAGRRRARGPCAPRSARARAPAAASPIGLLVGSSHLARRRAASAKRSARSRAAAAIRARRSGSSASACSASPSSAGCPGGTSSAVDAVADHVAVAGDVRSRRPGVPAANASVSTMPKLSPPSDGAHSTSASCSSRHFSVLAHAAERRRRPPRRAGKGATSSRVAPGDGQPRAHARGAQRLEGAQQHRQALALLGAAHEQQPQLVRRAGFGPRARRAGPRRSGSSGSGRRSSARPSSARPRRRRSARASLL